MCEPFYLCIYTFANRKITSETQSLCEQVPDDKSEKKCQKLEENRLELVSPMCNRCEI